MAKKKDKKDRKGGKKGSLADQLSRLDLNLSDEDQPAKPHKPHKPHASPSRPAPPPPEPELSEEELFRQAIENLDPTEIYQGKFQGQAGAPLPEKKEEPIPATPQASPEDEEDARKQVLETRENAFFEAMIGSVEPIEDRDKYRKPQSPHHFPEEDPTNQEDPDDRPARGLITPALPRDGEGLNDIPPLTLSQRSLFKRYQHYAISEKVPTLNLRGDTREEALRLLEIFVHQEHKEGTPYVEIIHGRGLQSEDLPVLKPAVLEWLEDIGLRYIRGYSPRRNTAGDYGSLIVELKTRSGGRKR